MKARKIPMRRCIGCRESFPQSELIRLTLWEDKIHVDRRGKSPGRGVYLCRNQACVEQARKTRAFQRNYKREFNNEITEAAYDEATIVIKEVVNGEESI